MPAPREINIESNDHQLSTNHNENDSKKKKTHKSKKKKITGGVQIGEPGKIIKQEKFLETPAASTHGDAIRPDS